MTQHTVVAWYGNVFGVMVFSGKNNCICTELYFKTMYFASPLPKKNVKCGKDKHQRKTCTISTFRAYKYLRNTKQNAYIRGIYIATGNREGLDWVGVERIQKRVGGNSEKRGGVC